MSDWAELLTAIAAVITAIGGTVVGVIQAMRAGAREREDAASGVAGAIDEAQNRRIDFLEAQVRGLGSVGRHQLDDALREAEESDVRRDEGTGGPA